MGTLSSKQRKNLPKSQFAIPETKDYPIQDQRHAVAALARVATNGTPAEKARVRAKVGREFPDLPSSKGAGKSQAAAHNRRTARRAGKKAG